MTHAKTGFWGCQNWFFGGAKTGFWGAKTGFLVSGAPLSQGKNGVLKQE